MRNLNRRLFLRGLGGAVVAAPFLGSVWERAAKAQGVSATGEMTKYKHTVWDEKLHPVDMAGIVNKDSRTLARMAEGNLRSRQYSDITPMGRGPLIIMRDESGSMAGEKHKRSLELEISLAVAFNEQDREFVSIPWNDGKSRIYVYGSTVNDRSFEKHIDSFYSGGTTIIHALQKATVFAKEYQKSSDILVLTDGEIGEREEDIKEACKEFKENGGRIWLCFGGVNRYYIKESNHKIWADGIISIDQINESDALFQMIQQSNTEDENESGRVRL